MARVAIGIVLLWTVVGCHRTEVSRWTNSKEVHELSEELQTKIHLELEKYCGTPTNPKLLGDENVSAEHLKFGAAIFQRRCAGCHGATGDGMGVATGPKGGYFSPRPRDYRRGIFKFTSTPYGSKPVREDLVKFIKNGSRGTSMPAFNLLPDEELQAVVDYVLVLTHRGELEILLWNQAENDDEIVAESTPELCQQILDQWQSANDQVVTPLTKPIAFSMESVAEGKKAFLSEGALCHKCHGEDGRGNAAENRGEDAWKHATRAADLTTGMFHGGKEPMDIYRRIYSGINGTPMPSFEAKLKDQPELFWHLVNYVQYISSARRRDVVEHMPTLRRKQPATKQEPQVRVDQPEPTASN